MTPRPLEELARFIGARVQGDGKTLIRGISGIKEAKPGDLTFVANSRYLPLLKSTCASAVITSLDVKKAALPIVRTENPSLAFAKLAALLYPVIQRHPKGVSPKAVIGRGVRLGKGVAIGSFAVIEEGASLGDRSVIYPHSYIGRKTTLGNDCVVYPNVAVRERVEIGHRVIIHSGTVIGSDGFGFATVKGIHHKIPQVGTVVIEDDVEIGANVTIDRARFGRTVVGRGTKIDNLVQIAHNVEIGPNSILVAQSGISGSTVLGSHVVLAGQAGVVGHIEIGDNVMVGAQAGVSKSVPPDAHVWGTPAKPLLKAKRVNAALQHLPELVQMIHEMGKRLAELEKLVGREPSSR
ncbi:MAG: UDP-3-O-(3-hydroxymyristoyl)glucosamine N-acyltransferase [Candidatus Omnitrophica bacterium]|nr:UDP-3-O-(3-hydroxymyristoyl)glucosamine N-acyltransferase [Candidatus Omnitrophota bacterium]